ncbi:MAG: riboflavin synthase subunit alpha [Aquabacterium sp.]
MYTGIVQGTGRIVKLLPTVSGLQLTIRFPRALLNDLQIGASVSVEGVCLSVVTIDDDLVAFDAINVTLERTNLGDRQVGDVVNLERSARQGDENGGHAMYGHVSDTARISSIMLEGPRAHIELHVRDPWRRYLFTRGFLSINGCSLTLADTDAERGWCRVNLIPETIRVTSFWQFKAGDRLNIEVEQQTQVMVDVIERVLERKLGHQLQHLVKVSGI